MSWEVSRRALLRGRLPFAADWRPEGARLVAWQDGRDRVVAAADPDQPQVARITMGSCLAHLGSFCTTCVERCPVPQAIGVVGHKPVIDPDICTGCGLCAQVCPAPQPAIRLLPTGA